MKNILFINDAFIGGGLETRVIEQIKILKNHKIRPFLLCRELNEAYSKHFIAVSDALTLKSKHDVISARDIIKDVDNICNFCLENKIDFIDCNPFWCALPATLAANKLQTPISFTLHGKISADFISKEYLTAQALYDTIFSYGFTQIFAVAEYLKDLYPHIPNIEIIRNGLPINRLESQSFKNSKRIAIASRLDEPKTQIIIDFLPKVYKSKAIEQIDIYGDGDHLPQLQDYITKHQMADKVNLCGWAKNFPKELNKKQYMLVFGMGRVVLEAIKSGVPVGILGYSGFVGLVNRDNLLYFSRNNLTSWEEPHTDLSHELKLLFRKPNNYLFKSGQLSIFNVEKIWQGYYTIINQLEYQDSDIIKKIYDELLQNPDANILTDKELFLTCVRLLSDGTHSISPRLFYNIFQNQFDQINSLSKEISSLKETNAQLREENSMSLNKIAKKRIISRIKKV